MSSRGPGVELRIANRVSEKYPSAHVNATCYNKLVLLTGEAPSEAAKADIEAIARGVPDVRSIVNELQIGDSTPFSARANDSYITSKVKARFLDARRSIRFTLKWSRSRYRFAPGYVTQKEGTTPPRSRARRAACKSGGASSNLGPDSRARRAAVNAKVVRHAGFREQDLCPARVQESSAQGFGPRFTKWRVRHSPSVT